MIQGGLIIAGRHLLGTVVEIVMGQAPPGKECNKSGRGSIFVKAGEFGDRFPFVREWTTKPLRFAKTGDTLVCVVGATCGKVNQGIDCAIGRSVAAVRPSSKIDPSYLYHFLATNVEILRAKSQGMAQGVITREMIRDLELPLPPLSEQKRIAEILDRAEALRSQRRAALALLDELTQSIFLDMFGDPVANPMGWKLAKMKDVVELITYGLTVRPKYVSNGIPLISGKEIRAGSIDFENAAKISQKDFDSLSEKAKPTTHDLLFSKTGSIGHTAIVATHSPFALAQNVARLTFNPAMVNHIYALFYLRSGSIQALAKRSVRGNAVKDLQLGVIGDFPFAIPPLYMQQKFADRIEVLQAVRETCNKTKDHFDQLFASLQHRAFRGEL